MGELLADHTTLRLSGPAARFLTHTDSAAWPDLAEAIRADGTAPFVLGGGSNTLAPDDGYPGTVIHMTIRGITSRALGDDLVEVVAQAGEPLAALVAYTVAEGLSGIEFLGGILGTTGAAPVQNTGAYGQQVSDTITCITAYDWRTGHTHELLPANAASATATASSSPTSDAGSSSWLPCACPAAWWRLPLRISTLQQPSTQPWAPDLRWTKPLWP